MLLIWHLTQSEVNIMLFTCAFILSDISTEVIICIPTPMMYKNALGFKYNWDEGTTYICKW